jgi:phage shock protein A
VSDAERGVLQMKLTAKKLELQRIELESKVANLTEQAKQATKSKQREKAILLLKQRRKLNDLCLKRMNMLDTLHQILEKIEEAHTNFEVTNTLNYFAKVIDYGSL